MYHKIASMILSCCAPARIAHADSGTPPMSHASMSHAWSAGTQAAANKQAAAERLRQAQGCSAKQGERTVLRTDLLISTHT